MRGYHVYNDIWEAAVGETLVCVREPRNAHDRYAVAVEKDGKHSGCRRNSMLAGILAYLGTHSGAVGLVRSTLLFGHFLRDLLHKAVRFHNG